MTDNICATVILYNPNEDIFKNIDSYATDLTTLIVVDNSELQNKEIIDKLLKRYDNVEYINNHENLGIATALNIACDKAIELKMDWILTMDQDSKFIDFKNFLLCCDHVIKTESDIGLITPNHTGDTNFKQNSSECNYSKKEMVITSANLINLTHFNKIGRFSDELFIDMVDYDFCNKVILNNLKIFMLEDHYIIHRIGEIFERKNLITGKIKAKIEHNAGRIYYMTRNRLYLSKTYSKTFEKEFNFFKTLNILFIHDITKILLYEADKRNKLYAKLIALVHFITGKMGRYTI